MEEQTSTPSTPTLHDTEVDNDTAMPTGKASKVKKKKTKQVKEPTLKNTQLESAKLMARKVIEDMQRENPCEKDHQIPVAHNETSSTENATNTCMYKNQNHILQKCSFLDNLCVKYLDCNPDISRKDYLGMNIFAKYDSDFFPFFNNFDNNQCSIVFCFKIYRLQRRLMLRTPVLSMPQHFHCLPSTIHHHLRLRHTSKEVMAHKNYAQDLVFLSP